MLSKTAFTTLFLFATFGIAFAQETSAKPVDPEAITYSRTVRYSDLDLSTEAGAKALLTRIRRAANLVCNGNDWRAPMTRSYGFRSCVQAAQSKAVADVGSPMVTALYNGSTIRLATK